MFKKEKTMTNIEGNETIIAQGVKVEGEFYSDGNVVIDGELKGSISTAMGLSVGGSAKIHANISAQSAVIAGEVKGNINATDSIELLASSVVTGDIETNLISVAPGSRLNGKVTMGKVSPAISEDVVGSEE